MLRTVVAGSIFILTATFMWMASHTVTEDLQPFPATELADGRFVAG